MFAIMKYKLHERSHAIVRLQVHLPLQQTVLFTEGQEQDALDRNEQTQLTAWFNLHANDPEARQYLYHDIPLHYIFNKRRGLWIARRSARNVIARMYQVQPSDAERFSLRLLLLHRPGVTSFEDVRTVDGETFATFKQAAMHLGLMEDDQEWRNCLEEASLLQMPAQMRELFATILIFNSPTNEHALFEEFAQQMSEDFLHQDRVHLNDPALPHAQRHTYHCIYDIHQRLRHHGYKPDDWSLPPLPPNFMPHEIPLEEQINVIEEQQLDTQLYQQLNVDQQRIADAIIHAISHQLPGRCFYIDGSGGTGKTFLYNTLVHILRGLQIPVTCVAFSGIAATLLINGSTAHSTLQIPIPLHPESTCNVGRATQRAQALIATNVFIWDEASMIPAQALTVVDRLFKDLMQSDVPFGGKFFILGGDFRQVLPVVRQASRAKIVNSCLKSSPVWPCFQKFQLTINMRAQHDNNYATFANWLLRVGNGSEPYIENTDEIPPRQDICLPSNDLHGLISHVYPRGPTDQPHYMETRCCLTPKNDQCHLLNDMILQLLPGPTTTYLSLDTVVADDPTEAAAYSVEFLNAQTPSGMPLHKLNLKVMISLLTPVVCLMHAFLSLSLQKLHSLIRFFISTNTHSALRPAVTSSANSPLWFLLITCSYLHSHQALKPFAGWFIYHTT